MTLSQKVGATIDVEENLFYGIFPEVEGFETAQIIEDSDDRFRVQFVIVSGGRRVTKNLALSWDEFMELKLLVDRAPEISPEDRLALHQDLHYLHTTDILEQIPTGQFVILKHINGRTIRGILLPFENNLLRIQTPVQVLSFPYHEVRSIAYREKIIERFGWQKWIFASAACVGILAAEVWNSQVLPTSDLTWHYRFLGTALGLVGGREISEAVNIIFSPRTKFEIAPNL